MMKLHIRSFATRLCIYTISFTVIVFLAVMTIFYTYSRDKITENAVQHTHGLLKNMVTQIDGMLMMVEASMRHTTWIIEENLAEPDSLRRIVTSVVRENDIIVGCGLAFEPGYYPEKGHYFMPYAFKDGKEKETFRILGGREYDYPCMDWYLIPRLLGKNYWSEPYYDHGGGNIVMTTYSVPLYNKQGRVYAIFTANISLSRFTDMVDELRPYKSSQSFLLSRNGSYLTHPDREKIMNETVLTDAFESHSKEYEILGREMMAGHTGTVGLREGGRDDYAFYTSIPEIGWSLCNICPGNVILHELDSASRRIIYIFIVGIGLLFVISYFIIKRIVRPLEDFSRSAREIAGGNFDAELPEVHSRDEMRDLYDSFVFMKQSLTDYVTELKTTTATKERIESELSIAQEIQMGMVPKTFPPFPGREDVDLHAVLRPAKEVGGDLYDFFLDEGKLYFAIGDVSGKGVPASLFMAITRTLFHTLAFHMASPGQIMTGMNNAIAESNEANMFVTLFIGILELETGVLRFCNAGHNPPIVIYPDGRVAFMKVKTNLFAGIMPDYQYEDEKIVLEKDSKLFLYTDGVTEAENKPKELYSDQRLLETIAENAAFDVRRLVAKTIESVADYVGEADQSDDFTMLAIHYKSKLKKDGERN